VTICIGAIAERDKAIVMVADRALTIGALQATNSGPGKIFHLGTSWYALVSGDLSFAEGIIKAARKELISNPALCDSEVEVSALLERLYKQKRDEAVEAKILRPQLLTIPLYISRPTKMHPLDKTQHDSIAYAINSFTADTTILICGFDASGCPHLVSVADPGISLSWDALGYQAIGIGEEAARVRLASMDTDRNEPLAKIIYNVFDAKVSTEEYQGISYEWDGEVLCKGETKSRKLPRPLINTMDREYRAFPRSPFDEGGNEPRNWWGRLDKFCKQLLPNTVTPKPNRVSRPKL
jgi:20S proteasome alpha/beta subunit